MVCAGWACPIVHQLKKIVVHAGPAYVKSLVWLFRRQTDTRLHLSEAGTRMPPAHYAPGPMEVNTAAFSPVTQRNADAACEASISLRTPKVLNKPAS